MSQGFAGGMAGTIGPDAVAKRMPQMAQELGELERSIENALKCANELIARLDSVSRASAPTPGNSNRVKEAEALAPMAERLRRANEAIIGLCHALVDARERLEV